MRKVSLVFGTYNSMPWGEREDIFDDAYQKAFKPFLNAIYKHPGIKPTLYYSGHLLELISKKYPEFHDVLSEMNSKKTMEILGGGFWEPILPLVSAKTRADQIEEMSNYISRKFGKRPRGCWIANQIWEQNLSYSLKYRNDMNYVFLPERAFPSSHNLSLTKPIITEELGKSIVVFPLKNSISNLFLKVPPETILENLKTLRKSEGEEIVVSLMIDGFLLGGGDSYKLCYEEHWLEKFFELVEQAKDWLECVQPGHYLRRTTVSREKVYIPGTTYQSLMSWAYSKGKDTPSPSLPSSYRDFLTIYRESTLLYAKMMHVEVMTNQIRGDKARKKIAKEELWKGQGHHVYWYGPTGGIYENRLRHAAYEALIEAEKATRERGIFKPAITKTDFDMDGYDEYLYNGSNFNAYIHLMGGSLIEFDYLPVSRNYLATLSQYPKSEPPFSIQKKKLNLPRHSFMDFILNTDETPATFNRSADSKESILSRTPYTQVSMEQSRVSLYCQCPVHGTKNALDLHKVYRFKRSLMEVEYTLTNAIDKNLDFLWAVEMNTALACDETLRSLYINSDNITTKSNPEEGNQANISSWTVHDVEKKVEMNFSLSIPANIWWKPLYIDYRAGETHRKTYQSTCFTPVWNVSIKPGENQKILIAIKIGRSKK